MNKRTKRVLIAVAGFLCVSFIISMSIGALANNPTQVSVSAQVASTLQLNMPTTAVNFGGGMLEAGQVYTQDITATINSNKGWSLKVTKNHDLQGPTETIPSANFTFGVSSGNPKVTYKAPAGTQFGNNVTVCSGDRGQNITSTVSYRLEIPWEQAPETYTATHTYTATQP